VNDDYADVISCSACDGVDGGHTMRYSCGSKRALMKAVRLLENGGPLVFNDVPTPTIARDEVW